MSQTPPPADTSGWLPLADASRRVQTVTGGLGGLFLGLVLCLPLVVLAAGAVPGMALAGLLVPVAAIAGALLGRARWGRTSWRLDERGLQVRRGLVWRSEILVPRSRVQHLDLERGPIERRFGVATLVVHTAGTRLHALRQSGFLDADAVALRDALLPEADRDDDAV